MKTYLKLLLIVLFVFMLTGCFSRDGITINKSNNQSETKLVESIECLTEGYVAGSVEGTKCDGHIDVTFKKDTGNLIVIKCRVLPADATNTKLKLSVDKEKGYDVDNPPEDTSNYEFWYRDNGDGTWTINILKAKSQQVTVQPTDRAGVKLVILIVVKQNGGSIVPPKA